MTALIPRVRDLGPAGPVDASLFREAMSRVGAAVHLVTTDGVAGRSGATVTALTSVTDSPPTLLVCLKRTGGTNAAIKTNRVFCVSTLGAGAVELAEIFAGRRREVADRFEHGVWTALETGAPALGDARAVIDCRVTEIVEAGSHSVIFGEVAGVRLGEKEPALVYLDRAYKAVP